MGVCNLQPENGDAYPLAWHDLFHSKGYFFGKKKQISIKFIIHGKKIIDLFFRDDKRMAFCKRPDVEERKEQVVFSYLIAGNFPINDPCENTWLSNKFLSCDFNNFEVQFPGRDINFHLVSDDFSQQPFGNR